MSLKTSAGVNGVYYKELERQHLASMVDWLAPTTQKDWVLFLLSSLTVEWKYSLDG